MERKLTKKETRLTELIEIERTRGFFKEQGVLPEKISREFRVTLCLLVNCELLFFFFFLIKYWNEPGN